MFLRHAVPMSVEDSVSRRSTSCAEGKVFKEACGKERVGKGFLLQKKKVSAKINAGKGVGS
ncbi:MAG: hypothetical protein A2018_01885 [Alphaproteobacteria bacterium GWF2_58_20]|nr:MAG: hypothetical protein A2018_01885 [Alphaproteobacteria bacterium GWF2_58_20]